MIFVIWYVNYNGENNNILCADDNEPGFLGRFSCGFHRLIEGDITIMEALIGAGRWCRTPWKVRTLYIRHLIYGAIECLCIQCMWQRPM